MQELTDKRRVSVSSVKRNTEGKPKIVRSKSKFINSETKGKPETGTLNGWKKTQIKKNDKNYSVISENNKDNVPVNSDVVASSTEKDLKPILNNDNSDSNQNGGEGNVCDKSLPNTGSVQEGEPKEAKKVSKKGSEKRVILPRDLTRTSLDNQSQASVEEQVQSTSVLIPQDRPRSVIAQNDSFIKSVIPYLPLSLAVVYLILNIFIPGSGTILSGLSILCCGKCRVQTKDDQRLVTLCMNVFVGVSQLFTVTFLLVGWLWSIAWGITMVTLAVELRKQKKQQRERELQAAVVTAFGNPVQVRSLFPGIK